MKYVRISIFCAFLLLSLYAAYLSRKDIVRLFTGSKPCSSVTTYSLGTFDKQFNISEEDFLAEAKKAETMWEDAAGKNLFELDPKGKLKVNLIYDYRQEATDELEDTGGTIEDAKEAYNERKARYDKLLVEYESKKASLEEDTRQYEQDKDAYDEQVDYWNDRGGAPPKEYKELEEDRESINEQADDINAKQKTVNKLAENINTSAKELNALGKRINMYVETYNGTLESAGEEFNEGEFVRDDEGERINVYQFDNNTMLRRLLVHELGHALGLNHVEDEEAIMYRLNQSKSDKLTNADLEELKNACGA